MVNLFFKNHIKSTIKLAKSKILFSIQVTPIYSMEYFHMIVLTLRYREVICDEKMHL